MKYDRDNHAERDTPLDLRVPPRAPLVELAIDRSGIDRPAIDRAARSIVTVARRAGVSVATVSRVLNDLPNVKPETARQVREAARQLGYKPPLVKRGPRNGKLRAAAVAGVRTGQIAVLTVGSGRHWLEMPVLASVLSGISSAAKELGLGLLLDAMPDVAALSPIVRRRQVAGAVVFLQSGVRPEVLTSIRRKMPIVLVMGAEGDVPDVDHISPDNVGVGYLAFRYLAGLGCDRLAFISADPSWHFMRLRGQAFANAASDARRTVRNYLVGDDQLVHGAYGNDSIFAESLEPLIDKFIADFRDTFRGGGDVTGPSTGLFVPTDLLTTRIYPLLIDRGVRPGTDVRIVSCDNEDVRLTALHPRPATIDIRPAEIGRRAVRRMLARLQTPDDPVARIQIAPRLVAG